MYFVQNRPSTGLTIGYRSAILGNVGPTNNFSQFRSTSTKAPVRPVSTFPHRVTDWMFPLATKHHPGQQQQR
jgi:hypothetical protein